MNEQQIRLDTIKASQWNDFAREAFARECRGWGVEVDARDGEWVLYQREIFHDVPEAVTVRWEGDEEDDSPYALFKTRVEITTETNKYTRCPHGHESLDYWILDAVADYERGEQWFKDYFADEIEAKKEDVES